MLKIAAYEAVTLLKYGFGDRFGIVKRNIVLVPELNIILSLGGTHCLQSVIGMARMTVSGLLAPTRVHDWLSPQASRYLLHQSTHRHSRPSSQLDDQSFGASLLFGYLLM